MAQLNRSVGSGQIDFVRVTGSLRNGSEDPKLLVVIGSAELKDIDAHHLMSFLYFQVRHSIIMLQSLCGQPLVNFSHFMEGATHLVDVHTGVT